MVSSNNSVTSQEGLSAGQQVLKWLQENRINNNRKQELTLDKDTVKKLVNGDFGISLKEFSDLYTYNSTMSALWGNNSANSLNSVLNGFIGNSKNEIGSAKSFLEAMEEKGVSNKSALKMYTALKTYKINSSFLNNNNFVNAKI